MLSLQNIKQSKLYPLYFLVQFPFLVPRLIANEGFGGAWRWTMLRFHMLLVRFIDRQPGFYELPITEFKSRLGFSLLRRAELLVYEEIFLDRCYAFAGFAELVTDRPHCVLDFGTHHGLFIDFILQLNRKAEVYGAEMGPNAFAVAQQRFTSRSNVHLKNVAIGGSPRRVKVGAGIVSVEQSIYTEQKSHTFEVEVVTPLDFIRLWNLSPGQITIIKMDIEGAEREVFEKIASIEPLLKSIQAFVVEIHAEVDVTPIARACETNGLKLIENRGINYFFRRV